MPQPPRAAVAIHKGVYELELVVEDASLDERMVTRAAKPLEQVTHKLGNHVVGRRRVNELVARVHAHPAVSQASGVLDKTGHHKPMRREKIVKRVGVKLGGSFVGLIGVLNLPHVLRRSEHVLAVQDRRHLVERQRVVLYEQRRVDGANLVFAP